MTARKLILILIPSLFLTGCIGAALVAGAGAGAVGGKMAYDNRTVHAQYSDRTISNKAHDKIVYDNQLYKHAHINVTTYNGIVLLVGEVDSPELKSYAEQLVQQVPGVIKVYNELQVGDIEATFARSDDTWITTKVKSMMMRRSGLLSSQIKVVTENAVVYLMGNVSKEQAALATDTARRVAGVQKVVEVFEYQS